jgi:hypothetical protein
MEMGVQAHGRCGESHAALFEDGQIACAKHWRDGPNPCIQQQARIDDARAFTCCRWSQSRTLAKQRVSSRISFGHSAQDRVQILGVRKQS